MAVFPKSNLSASSVQWGREVQQRIEAIESETSSLMVNDRSATKQLQDSYRRLDSIINSVFSPGTTQINGYNIKAGTINAASISAGTFKTSDSGQRVVLSDLDNITFYNSSGNLTAQMEGTAAFSSNTFALKSATESLNTSYYARHAGGSIYLDDEFLSISLATQTGATLTDVTSNGLINIVKGGSMSIESEAGLYLGYSSSTGTNASSISLGYRNITLTANSNTNSTVNINGLIIGNSGTIQGFNTTSMYSSGQIDADDAIFGTSLSAKSNGGIYGGSIDLSGNATFGGGYIYGESGWIRASFDASGEFFQASAYQTRSYTGTANCYVTVNGVIGKTSSASKYKLLIEEKSDYDFSRILQLKPKTWFDKRAVEVHAEQLTALANGDTPIESVDKEPIERISGLIAEDLLDAGLEDYVIWGGYKEDGTREVEGIQYDRLWTLLIPLVKQLTDRIEVLENN